MFDFLSKTAPTSEQADEAARVHDAGQLPGDQAPSATLTLAEALELIRYPRPAPVPASTFTGLNDPDELALAMLTFIDMLDLNRPEIQALIASTAGSFYGDVLAGRLAPKTHVGKHKAMRRKAQPKCKQPRLASLFKLFPSEV